MAEPREGGKMNVLLLVDKKVLEQVDDFRFTQRIPTRAEAMRRLIELGLELVKPQAKKASAKKAAEKGA